MMKEFNMTVKVLNGGGISDAEVMRELLEAELRANDGSRLRFHFADPGLVSGFPSNEGSVDGFEEVGVLSVRMPAYTHGFLPLLPGNKVYAKGDKYYLNFRRDGVGPDAMIGYYKDALGDKVTLVRE